MQTPSGVPPKLNFIGDIPLDDVLASGGGYVNQVTRLWAPGGELAALGYQVIVNDPREEYAEGFEVPGILGLPAGIYVFSTKIYTVLHSSSSLPAYGEANALAMLYLFVAIVGTYFYSRVITKSERFTIITGKGYRPRLLQLGVWRWPAFSLVLLYLALSAIVPFLVLGATLLFLAQGPLMRRLRGGASAKATQADGDPRVVFLRFSS